MARASNAREALIAEALGDLATLLDRVDAILPNITAATRTVAQAEASLDVKAEAFERRIAGFTEAAKAHLVDHVARQTRDIGRSTAQAQTQAMEAAARELFRAELAPALRRLGQAVEATAARQEALGRWWPYTATALAASTVTWALAFYLLKP